MKENVFFWCKTLALCSITDKLFVQADEDVEYIIIKCRQNTYNSLKVSEPHSIVI